MQKFTTNNTYVTAGTEGEELAPKNSFQRHKCVQEAFIFISPQTNPTLCTENRQTAHAKHLIPPFFLQSLMDLLKKHVIKF